jgi:hypothetical protein
MITLSCYHYIFIMLAWQGYHVIMTGWSCYHYRVIMLSWYRYHVIWQGYHTILMTLLCYLERIILSWQHYHLIMIKCYQSRLSCIKIALLREKCMINYYHNNMIVFMITFNHVRYFFSWNDIFRLENLIVWQISVLRYGLLLRNEGILIMKRWKNSVGHI